MPASFHSANFSTEISSGLASKVISTSAENENISDTCEPTGQLIFKNKGQEILKAEMTTVNIKDSISCEYVTYYINSQRIRQKMTYRIGMSIDQIYWEKVDPKGNPVSSEGDTTKFKYEVKNNNR